jgi:hypothetical protein
MSIQLQTSLGNDIPNEQASELTAFDLRSNRDLPLKHKFAKFRTNPIPRYNCHGLTFASRRTRIFEDRVVRLILKDDSYVKISSSEVSAGDIVVYIGVDGEIDHSGIIVQHSRDPIEGHLVLSKWGGGAEVIHRLHDVPEVYGKRIEYYRCDKI